MRSVTFLMSKEKAMKDLVFRIKEHRHEILYGTDEGIARATASSVNALHRYLSSERQMKVVVERLVKNGRVVQMDGTRPLH